MPSNTTNAYIQKDLQFSAKNYHPLPIVLSRGEGIWVYDVEGQKYLDCLSAYSALSHGHVHPKILQALTTQAQRLTLTSRAFHNDQMGNFLEKLCKLCQMEMALPMNTGAEAVETAIKAARKWGYQIKGVPPNQAHILACTNNFHGRTTTIISFSSEPQYKEGFGPFTPGFELIEFGNLQQLQNAITPNTVAFLTEPIQGEGGIILPPQGFLQQAKKLCRQHNVLFMLDEIQTGLGRTGKMFAFQHEEDAKPDVLILGKALGGGVYPVSAVLASKEILGVFQPGDHGSTFGGNPLAAAVASAALDVLLEEKLVENSQKMGQYLLEQLQKINSPHIQEIRGKGLFVAIEIKTTSGPARPFCEKLKDLGILCKETHQQVIRLAPPLIIQKPEIKLIVEKIQTVLQEK
ncbi:MAG: ornithine--oxo-acid transaminase [Planctomycetota bacterium]|nr:MAG: ornithine--oxo-acid transaminase [Planctomycetota bacterium]